MELNINNPETRAIFDQIVNYIESKPVKKWLEVKEVEAIYRIRRTQLYELKKQNKINCKYVGSKLLISVASIEKFMNET